MVVGGRNFFRLDHPHHAQQGYKTSEDDVWNKMQLLDLVHHSSFKLLNFYVVEDSFHESFMLNSEKFK